MAQTIRNPIEWSADLVKDGLRYTESVGEHLGGEGADPLAELPQIRQIGISDLKDSLKKGVADFAACRTDIAFLCIIYPIVGLFVTWLAFDRNLLPLIFPAASGFALLGPVAAVSAYELSRRRERGEPASWGDALKVLASPSFAAILVLGLGLLAVFAAWMLAAFGVYSATMGPEAPESARTFLRDVLTTGAGWTMIVVGFAVGFVFAAAVLAVSLISFPLLLDRNVGLPAAVLTSVKVTMANLRTVATWGLIVAAGLALGSIPAFLGLIIVMPVLGHATWHLYRKAVVPPEAAA